MTAAIPTIAEAAHRRWLPTGRLAFVDAATLGAADCLEQVRTLFLAPADTIILRHAEQLPTEARRDLADLLSQLFARKRGETEVRLRLEKPRDFSVILDVAPKVRPDKEFWAEVERICGPESVEVLAS